MNEDFVSFDLAKKLKEKGFNKRVCGYYRETRGLSICNTPMNSNALENEFSAPTISQVLKWLREEKKIHISIDIWGRTWGYDILDLPSGNSLHWAAYDENINNYEQAALAGIEYVLDNLI